MDTVNKDKFDQIMSMVKEYTFPYSDGEGTMTLSITEPADGVVVLDAGSQGEKLLTLTYAGTEIFTQYTKLGADTHVSHIPMVDRVIGVDILLSGSSPFETFQHEIRPRLDYLVEWSQEYIKEWAVAE